jgi:hypothetical protein
MSSRTVTSNGFSPEDYLISQRLADPNVDQAWADQYIEEMKREVQATWTERIRQSRSGCPYTRVTVQALYTRLGVAGKPVELVPMGEC